MAELPERPGNVLLQIFVVDQLGAALLERAFAGRRLSPGEFALASVIRAFAPVTPTELSSFLGIPPTTLSSRLARLEERRLVRRRRNPHDGRSSLVEVTALGRRRVEALFPAFGRALQAIRDELGEKRLAETMRAMGRLEDALRAALAVRPAARSASRPARMSRSGE
jgi:DNA-binding MarR family transcriptional regulator